MTLVFWQSRPLPLKISRIQVVYASTELDPVRLLPPPAAETSNGAIETDHSGFRNSGPIPQPVPVASIDEASPSDGVAIPADIGRSLGAGSSLEASGPVTASDQLQAIPRLEIATPDIPEVLPPEILKSSPPGRRLAQAHPVKQELPTYPPMARTARVQGVVLLDADITESGMLENVTVIDGHPMLIPAAVDAVRKWRYAPATLDGVPVRSSLRVTVRFRLDFN
jgi:protein TonB